MEGKHWTLLAMILGGLGTALAGLTHGWIDATTPTFWGGLLVMASGAILAVFTAKPNA
jgi:hypothetical protein